ncbi:DUF58 domain-containing protein [Agromyces soli]
MPAATARRARAMPRLTRRGATLVGVGAALVAICLWFDLRDVLLLAFVAVAMPLVALAYTALRLPRLAVTRSFAPPSVTAGSSTRVRLVVQNRSRRTFDGARWRDETPAELLGPGDAVLPAVGPWERLMPSGDDTVRLEYLLRTPRRGAYPIGPLRISIGDPFGLARMERTVGSPREFVVTPRVAALGRLLPATASVDGAMRGLQRLTHPNSDELIAREYRYGDPLRRVNWAATARRGELMVREEEQRGDPEARLLLDTTLSGRPEGARRHDDAPNFEFELAVEVAASLGVHLIEHGHRLRFESLEAAGPGAASDAAVGEYRSQGGAPLLLDALARVQPPRQLKASQRPRLVHGAAAARGAHVDAAAARGRETRMPGFAVLVQPDDEGIAALVAMRRAFAPAIAVVLPPVAERHVEQLEHADWRVLRIRRAADLADAWEARRGSGRRPREQGGPGEPGEPSPIERLLAEGDDDAR